MMDHTKRKAPAAGVGQRQRFHRTTIFEKLTRRSCCWAALYAGNPTSILATGAPAQQRRARQQGKPLRSSTRLPQRRSTLTVTLRQRAIGGLMREAARLLRASGAEQAEKQGDERAPARAVGLKHLPTLSRCCRSWHQSRSRTGSGRRGPGIPPSATCPSRISSTEPCRPCSRGRRGWTAARRRCSRSEPG